MTRTLEQLTQYSYCNFFDFKVFFKVENLGRYHWGRAHVLTKLETISKNQFKCSMTT